MKITKKFFPAQMFNSLKNYDSGFILLFNTVYFIVKLCNKKSSFTSIQSLCCNFGCKIFPESNFPGMMDLCETNLQTQLPLAMSLPMILFVYFKRILFIICMAVCATRTECNFKIFYRPLISNQ